MGRRSRVPPTLGPGTYSLGLHRRDGVNRAFGGGLPKGSIVVIEGEYGTGKSVLTGRFAHGLTEEDHETTFLSTERPVGTFLSQMLSLSYDVRNALHERDLLYLFGDIARLSRDSNQPPELLRRLTTNSRMWDSDVVFLDSFDDVLRFDPGFEELVDETDRRRAAREVLSFLQRVTASGRTVVLTLDPTGLPNGVVEPFRHIPSVVLGLETRRGGRVARRRIDVKRYAAAGGPVDDQIDFSIRVGRGVVIDTQRVVRSR
jgi:flagellar protein FlaH